VEVVASLSQGRTAAAQCGLFTYKSVPVIFEPPWTIILLYCLHIWKPHDISYLCIARTLKSLWAIQSCKHVLAGGGDRARYEAAVYTLIITPERLPPCMYLFQ